MKFAPGDDVKLIAEIKLGSPSQVINWWASGQRMQTGFLTLPKDLIGKVFEVSEAVPVLYLEKYLSQLSHGVAVTADWEGSPISFFIRPEALSKS